MTTVERKESRTAVNDRLKRKSRGEKERRGVNEELRYTGWFAREGERERDSGRTKEKLRSEGCKARERREKKREKRETGLRRE